jgi:hypothetical protein
MDGEAAELVAIADPLLSRTHLAVGVSRETVWVEDRGSANGTELHLGDQVVALSPDHRTAVALPCRLQAGDTTVTIAAQEPR